MGILDDHQVTTDRIDSVAFYDWLTVKVLAAHQVSSDSVPIESMKAA